MLGPGPLRVLDGRQGTRQYNSKGTRQQYQLGEVFVRCRYALGTYRNTISKFQTACERIVPKQLLSSPSSSSSPFFPFLFNGRIFSVSNLVQRQASYSTSSSQTKMPGANIVAVGSPEEESSAGGACRRTPLHNITHLCIECPQYSDIMSVEGSVSFRATDDDDDDVPPIGGASIERKNRGRCVQVYNVNDVSRDVVKKENRIPIGSKIGSSARLGPHIFQTTRGPWLQQQQQQQQQHPYCGEALALVRSGLVVRDTAAMAAASDQSRVPIRRRSTAVEASRTRTTTVPAAS